MPLGIHRGWVLFDRILYNAVIFLRSEITLVIEVQRDVLMFLSFSYLRYASLRWHNADSIRKTMDREGTIW